MVSLVGRTVRGYHLVRRLQAGGMGEVYLAQESSLGRTVALKILHPPVQASASTRQQVRRFRQEIDMVAALDHPGILSLDANGYARLEGRWLWYLVMPYCAGGSLADWLARTSAGQPLSQEMVVPLIVQVADALAYAHAQGICHLDVKAANLLLAHPVTPGEVPRLLLADFGVARCWQEPSTHTEQDMEVGTIWGTPGVMAPEQWHGMPSPASDQYALAVLAYTLLTGRAPFVGSPAQLCRQHVHTPPVAPSLLRPDVPHWVDAVVLQALAKDPTRRFASISQFAQALAHALASDEQGRMPSIDFTMHESRPPENVQQAAALDPVLHAATTIACLAPLQMQTTKEGREPSSGKGAQIAATQPAVQLQTPRQEEAARRQKTALKSQCGSFSDGQMLRSPQPSQIVPPSAPISWGVGVGGLLYLLGSACIAALLPEQFWLVVPLFVVSLGGGFWVDGCRERRHPDLLEHGAPHPSRSHPR
jgi:serine/threonine protein kinase